MACSIAGSPACPASARLAASSSCRASSSFSTRRFPETPTASFRPTAGSIATDANPSYYGDAVGHWDGDTLVVETTNFVEDTWFGEEGYFHSDAMRVIERLWRVGENLAYQVTVDDPKVLTQPWTNFTHLIKPSTEPLEESPVVQGRRRPSPAEPRSPLAALSVDTGSTCRVRPSGLVPRRANIAWKNAPSGRGCRWPRRFSWLQGRCYEQSLSVLIRRHSGVNQDRRGLEACGRVLCLSCVTRVRRAAARGRSPGHACIASGPCRRGRRVFV